MIIQLTPETFFEHINKEGPLHIIMHYGETCGPCKATMPHFEILERHFDEHKITNVKFYKFHQWQPEYKEFIESNSLDVRGVPTFRYYYYGEVLHQVTAGYNNPNNMKEVIVEVVKGIEATMGGFSLYES